MSAHAPLLLAYGVNIALLVPVCAAMFSGRVDSVFQGAVADEPGLRLLVGSLWLAILLASVAGLLWPRFFAPLLLVEVVYKAVWLGTFIVPAMAAGGHIPVGIALCFFAVVVTDPFLFWFGYARVVG